jgi:hypothetical protein
LERPGWQFLQSGPWNDRILCDRHEKALAAPDDYAVKFCRAYAARPPGLTARAIDVPNPKPHLLTLFAYAMVWRSLAAKGVGDGLGSLGPYRSEIEGALFGGAAPALPFTVTSATFRMPNGDRAKIALGAYRTRIADRTAWHFRVSFLDFLLFTDRRGLPAVFVPWQANSADPVPVYQTDSMGVEQARILAPLMAKASERY